MPEVRSSNQFIGHLLVYCQLYWKDENKEKEDGNGPFFKKGFATGLYIQRIFDRYLLTSTINCNPVFVNFDNNGGGGHLGWE